MYNRHMQFCLLARPDHHGQRSGLGADGQGWDVDEIKSNQMMIFFNNLSLSAGTSHLGPFLTAFLSYSTEVDLPRGQDACE